MTPTPHHDPDDDLRRLLRDAVDDVHPQGTPADIRRRAEEGNTAMSTPSNRWLPITLAAAAAIVVVIGGTFWLTSGDGANPPVAGPSNSSSPSDVASPSESTSENASESPTETESAAPTHAVALPVYYAGESTGGPRLFREFQRTEVCAEQECAWTAAVQAAVGGSPLDPDYRSLWPSSTSAQWVKYDGASISVSLAQAALADRPGGMDETQARMAVQQVVYTAQAAVNDGRKPVQIVLDGKPASQVLGLPADKPFTAGNADETLAPVQVFSPAEGATVGSTFEVTGQAAAFEANVQWELMQGDKVVQRNFTTAAECCTLAPYSFTVKGAAPGRYTLVVHDDDASGQGRVNSDTKQITVK